jgi:small subunit ribosomal protein S15
MTKREIGKIMDSNGSTGSDTGALVGTQGFEAVELESGSLALTSMSKEQVIEKFKRSPGDTGSPEVQIALLTQRLQMLAGHFAGHPKDHHSRRGMLDIVSARKRLLHYLKNEEIGRYRATIAALGLRK